MTSREYKYHRVKNKVRFVKNVIKALIHVGGKPIDFSFFEESNNDVLKPIQVNYIYDYGSIKST